MTSAKIHEEQHDLVVIGAGSAGMAAAIAAYDAGITDIVILDKENSPGGILLQCIHNGFGLHRFKEELTGPEYAERYLVEIRRRGILCKNRAMVLDMTPDKEVYYSSESDGFCRIRSKAIICATGCSERTRGAIRIPGDRPSGVMTAGLAQQYLNIDGYFVGKRIFILGSGDIGLIMARRMTLEGARVLGVAELLPYSNGLNRNIVQCLNDYQIPLYLSHSVKSIHGKERLEKIVLARVDDKFQFIAGTEQEFLVDTLLLSVGLIPSNPLLEKIGVKIHPKTRGPLVDETMQTSIPGIFSCGNSLHVHDLVDFVSEEGEMAGRAAAQYIRQLDPQSGASGVNGLKSAVNSHYDNQGNNTVQAVSGKRIVTRPLEGIGYLLPSFIDYGLISEDNDGFVLKFRVTKPYQKVTLLVKQGDTVLKKLKKNYLLPAEMEHIKMKKSELVTAEHELTVEVSND